MPVIPKIDRLILLLQEQRLEVATRSIEVRGSEAWDASCARLDRINERIMRSPNDVPLPVTLRPPSSPPLPGRADRVPPHH